MLLWLLAYANAKPKPIKLRPIIVYGLIARPEFSSGTVTERRRGDGMTG